MRAAAPACDGDPAVVGSHTTRIHRHVDWVLNVDYLPTGIAALYLREECIDTQRKNDENSSSIRRSVSVQ